MAGPVATGSSFAVGTPVSRDRVAATLSGYCGSVKMAPTCWLRIALLSFIISEADGACVSSA